MRAPKYRGCSPALATSRTLALRAFSCGANSPSSSAAGGGRVPQSTASIDSETEARLQQAIERVLENRTAIVIAHRLSTIRKADRILVFHKGRIVEQGTHRELLEHGGVYARLHRLQFAESSAEAATEI